MTALTHFTLLPQPTLTCALERPGEPDLHPFAIELRGTLALLPGWQLGDVGLFAGKVRVGGLQALPLPPDGEGRQRWLLRGVLGLVGLRPEDEAEVRLRLTTPNWPTAIVRAVARLGWRRRPLPPADGARRPLLVWVVGRSGSTAVMQWLAAHPDLVTLPDYPYEGRIAQSLLNRLAVGAQPQDPWHSGGGSGAEENFHATPRLVGFGPVGSNAQTPRPRFLGYLADRAILELAALTAQQIVSAYAALALDLGRAPEAAFVEKLQPTFTATLAAELYPEARHLFLVRDPRDTFTSWQRYFPTSLTAEELLEEFAAKQLAPHLAAWRSWGRPAGLLRYERFVADPAGTLAPALQAVDLPADPALMGRIAAAVAARPLPATHATSASPAASVGRWHAADPAWRRAMTASFGDYLETFGYPPEAAGPDAPRA